jgi:putative ABC transport system permease protein
LLGVGISFALTFPISAIVKAVAGGSITTNIAVMDPISSIALVVISVILTMISGLIPAVMAAKQDPVKALRSE